MPSIPRWTRRLRPSLSRPQRRQTWVRPANAITHAIEQELATGLPPHLPSQPAPVPAPVVLEATDDQAQADQSSRHPSSAA